MNHASLFSGIGGAEVAASMLGWQNLFHCEIQPFPRKVLDYWFPNSESYEDITKTDFTKWGVRSMFSPEDSPANHSPSLAEERERTITATSGRKCYELYAKSTPLGSLVKTLLESRQWWSPAKLLKWDAQPIFSKRVTYTEKKADSHSTKSVQISKPKDIPSSRLLFRLVPSERPIEEIEYGLLPTPTAFDMGSGRMNKSLSVGSAERPTLALAARKGILPTPSARDWKGCTNPGVKKANGNIYGETLPDTVRRVTGGTSQLNPLFVEEMMGFPLMWTALPFLSQSGDKHP